MDSFDATLKRVRRLSATTLDFRFQRDDGGVVEFLPGQFFRFRFEDSEGGFERSYSLCNHVDSVDSMERAGKETDDSGLDLVISEVENGRATRLLFSAEPGLAARVTGPFGRLVIPDRLPKRLFLVATSVGIAPFMPMLFNRELMMALNEGRLEVILLFGIRDRNEFLYREAIMALSERAVGFKPVICYSQETLSDPAPHEHQGYVTRLLGSYQPDPGTDHVLLCGNPAMVDDCFALLKASGFKAKQVTREKYVFARDVKKMDKPALTDAQKKLIAEKMKKYRQ